MYWNIIITQSRSPPNGLPYLSPQTNQLSIAASSTTLLRPSSRWRAFRSVETAEGETLLDVMKVDVCPPVTVTQTESCRSESEAKERNKPTDHTQSSLLLSSNNSPRETFLHPPLAPRTLKTALNLPELIGRKEKLVWNSALKFIVINGYFMSEVICELRHQSSVSHRVNIPTFISNVSLHPWRKSLLYRLKRLQMAYSTLHTLNSNFDISMIRMSTHITELSFLINH